MNMNLDWQTRDALIFGAADASPYDIKQFKGMSSETLARLVREGFADPEETQNEAPSIEKFLELAEQHPEMTFHGYVVSPTRPDYRVSVEGFDAPADEVLVNAYHYADEFEVQNGWLHTWWD